MLTVQVINADIASPLQSLGCNTGPLRIIGAA